MPQPVPFAHERFRTMLAGIWTFTGVRSPVRHQMTFRYKIFGTQITLEIPFSLDAFIVTPLMEEQIALQRKRFSTFHATERTFAVRVTSTHVIDEMLLPSERFIANGADMRTVATSVMSHVIRQMFLSGECFRTKLALMRFVNVIQ